MNPDYTYEAQRCIDHYTEMSQSVITRGSSMLREVTWQFVDMANGGNGGPLGYYPEDYVEIAVNNLKPVDEEPTCRSYNYPGYPDSFFQEVCDAMGWMY